MCIEDIVEEYSTYIYKYALKLTCDPHKAEDIAQETLISAWKSMDQIREEKAIKKWLQKVCLNHFLMDYRKSKKEATSVVENIEELEQEGRVLVSMDAGPEEEVLVDDAIREIQNGCFSAMAKKLSINQRIAFSLVDMFGLSIADVAELLELSENATKALLHRARTNLEQFFADHCNLLDEKNPCSCQGWINFSTNHAKNQEAAQEVFHADRLFAPEKQIDESVKGKLRFLYTHIPEKKPDEQWFESVISSFKSSQ